MMGDFDVDSSVLKVAVAFLAVLVGVLLHLSRGTKEKVVQVNTTIELDNPKVVNRFSVSEIEELPKCKEKGMAVFCRCWKSKSFPFCDGSHTRHNKERGDNLGPLVISLDPKQ